LTPLFTFAGGLIVARPPCAVPGGYFGLSPLVSLTPVIPPGVCGPPKLDGDGKTFAHASCPVPNPDPPPSPPFVQSTRRAARYVGRINPEETAAAAARRRSLRGRRSPSHSMNRPPTARRPGESHRQQKRPGWLMARCPGDSWPPIHSSRLLQGLEYWGTERAGNLSYSRRAIVPRPRRPGGFTHPSRPATPPVSRGNGGSRPVQPARADSPWRPLLAVHRGLRSGRRAASGWRFASHRGARQRITLLDRKRNVSAS
jgi:hypothetical protein